MAATPRDAEQRQYEVLLERTWRYSDLLWKNLLAYGAAVGSMGALHFKVPEIDTARPWVFVVGGAVLFLLGLIQVSNVRALRRSIETVCWFEKKIGNHVVTRPPSWRGPFGAYALAALTMVAFSMFVCVRGAGSFQPPCGRAPLAILVVMAVPAIVFSSGLVWRAKDTLHKA